MKTFLTLLNVRTYSIALISTLSSFLTLRYNFQFHYSFVLAGLFIVFPLVKSLQFAFKRRERALEYLSLFKSGLLTVDQYLQHSKKIPSEIKLKGSEIIMQISDVVLNYLRTGQPGETDQIHAQLIKVSEFLHLNKEEISTKTVTVMLRHMKDVQTSAIYLISLVRHKTVLILRIFSFVFIAIFSIIQAPLINSTFEQSPFLVYPLTIFTSLILITFYNVQQQLENPFDQIGYDDIVLDDFRVVITPSKTHKTMAQNSTDNNYD